MTEILVYAPIPTQALGERLGLPEYSYTFVLNAFLPVLRTLGDVVEVSDPSTEVDARYSAARERGEECVFLCFSPPHRAPTGLRCPTSTVFAWEFDTIPDEPWDDDPRHDWRTVLADHGRAIVLSQHTASVVRRVMGEDFAVTAIPTPQFDRFAAADSTGPHGRTPDLGQRTVRLTGTVFDSAEFEFTARGIRAAALVDRAALTEWDGEPLALSFTEEDAETSCLVGFYSPEVWGTWSRVGEPWAVLPFSVDGPVEIVLTAYGAGVNAGRRITATLGEQTRTFRLPGRRSRIVLRFDLTEPSSVLQFRGLSAAMVAGIRDERTMGIGLIGLTIRRPGILPARLAARVTRFGAQATVSGYTPTPTDHEVELSGVVFTSVLNPVDHRKNWELMIYAFCHALREEPEATLVLKMTHRTISSFFSNLQYFLQRVGPTRCRVLVLHGFLSDDEYRTLIDASTYYVNASSAEGLCMPLTEFMSAGVPAIAPDNSAMADYISPASAFVVASEPGVEIWPHDPRMLLRTLSNRIDWGSLTGAFRDAYRTAMDDPQRYARMSAAAVSVQRELGSDERVAQLLREFIDPMVRAS